MTWVVRTRVMVTPPRTIDQAWMFIVTAGDFGVATQLELCDPFPAFEVEL